MSEVVITKRTGVAVGVVCTICTIVFWASAKVSTAEARMNATDDRLNRLVEAYKSKRDKDDLFQIKMIDVTTRTETKMDELLKRIKY